MAYAGTNPEMLLVRATLLNSTVQCLIGRLAANGVLDMVDLTAMRESTLRLAADLKDAGVSAGDLLAQEANAWWDVAEVHWTG